MTAGVWKGGNCNSVRLSCTVQIVVYRTASFSSTAISCGQHRNFCVWQLDLATGLRKLTSTALLSCCRRSSTEHRRTSLTSTIPGVCVLIQPTLIIDGLQHHDCYAMSCILASAYSTEILLRDACSVKHGITIVRRPSVRPSVCLSVRPSVTLRYREHIGWTSSKLITRTISFDHISR